MRSLPSLLALLALSACDSKWEAADLDGDGYTVAQGDCWESDGAADGIASADIHPGATETWYDGFDQDCSGGSDFDKDGDGHAAAAFPDPSGALPSDDCWDDPDVIPDGFGADAPEDQVAADAVNPDATETWYDGIDQDCGGEDDYDQDGDGFGSAAYGAGDDCFDSTDDVFENGGGLEPDAVNPDAEESWYDGTDADCAGDDDFDQDGDGFPLDAECDDLDPARYPDPEIPEVWYDGLDQNCDGNDGDQDGDGYYAADYAFEIPEDYAGGDCWDDPAGGADWGPLNGFDPLAPASVNPGAAETWYDGLDQDCSGGGDFDQDGDGFATDTYADAGGLLGDDCDDAVATINPGETETWYDGDDQDCSGGSDFDQDGDGYDTDTDCADTDLTISPGALETCGNTVDEDCSGSANDEDAVGCSVFYADADGDGFGADAAAACLCEAEGDYTATDDGDCDDALSAVNPDGAESCATAYDDDCDGDTNAVGAVGCTNWYTDVDNDGYGTTASQCACAASGTYRATNDDDCNDGSASISPADVETCNSVDDDCDGSVDDGLPQYYVDADGDAYGAGDGSCTSSGRVANDDDCDDDSVYVYPGAEELCDGQANDCSTASAWAEADEDGLASYVDASGEYEDISASFGATAANYQLQSSGTYYFCGGTFNAKLVGSNDTVTLEGVYGAASTTIENNTTAGATLSVTGGAVTARGLTISGGVGSGSAGNTYGGGVIASATAMPTAAPTLTLEDCVVTDNTAAYGGGVAVYNYAWLKLDGAEVHANVAATNGGGVWVSTYGKLTAEGALIYDNDASGTASSAGGGGIFAAGSGTVSLVSTDVYDNTAVNDGGGIYLDDGTLTMTASDVYGNAATQDGGGIHIDTGTSTCSLGGIYDNSSGDHGGGVYLSNHSSTTASFSSSSCDFGTGALDNSPTDVTVKTGGSSYADYTTYTATATFVCSNASDVCTP
jgi:hypothetical protein